MQYISIINKNFKVNYRKYQIFLKKHEEMKIIKEKLGLDQKNLLVSKEFTEVKKIPQINASSIFKPKPTRDAAKLKKLASKVLKSKKNKFFNEEQVEKKESFLITQSVINAEIQNSQIQEDTEIKKPFLRLFEEKRFLKKKILEAIEKVKVEKKWIA